MASSLAWTQSKKSRERVKLRLRSPFWMSSSLNWLISPYNQKTFDRQRCITCRIIVSLYTWLIFFPFLSQCMVGVGVPPASHWRMWAEPSDTITSGWGTSLRRRYGARIDLLDLPDFSDLDPLGVNRGLLLDRCGEEGRARDQSVTYLGKSGFPGKKVQRVFGTTSRTSERPLDVEQH